MYGKPFNPRRPFGEVHGMPGVGFDQDGQLYNPQKQPVDVYGNLMELEPAAAQAAASEPELPPPPPENPDDDIPADEKFIDLLAWANGDPELNKLPWSKVKAEITRVLGDASAAPSRDAGRKAVLDHFNKQ